MRAGTRGVSIKYPAEILEVVAQVGVEMSKYLGG